MSTDYRSLFDRDFIAAFDLGGKDVTITITKVEGRKLKSERGEQLKPVIYFEGSDKAFVGNKTNGKIIAAMYGNHTEDWVGKRITIYGTTTSVGGEVKDCIRVRPGIPAAGKKAA
jgi:hypothetical protein